MSNIEEDSLKRVNIIIEKTKAYDNCVFPIGTRGEFGALYISDLKGLLSELETYKKIAEKLAKYSVNCAYGIPVKFKDTDELMKIVREEVENETNKARHKNT